MLGYLKVKYRLLIAFLLLIFFNLILGISAIIEMRELSSLTEKLYRHPFSVTKASQQIEIAVLQVSRYMRTIALTKDSAVIDEQVKRINEHVEQAIDLIPILKERFLGDQALVSELEKLFVLWHQYREDTIKLKREGKDAEVITLVIGRNADLVAEVEGVVSKISSVAQIRAETFLAEAIAQKDTIILWFSITILVTVILAVIIAFVTAHSITAPLGEVVKIANSIAMGKLDNFIDLRKTDEFGNLFKTIDAMQKQLRERISEINQIADDSLRLNSALDNVTTPVLIMDINFKVIYLNQSCYRFFKKEEAALREELSQFNADNLLGNAVDCLHKNPQNHRQFLQQLTHSEWAKLELDNRHIEYFVTPVINKKGEQIGYVKEFNNRTAEVLIEQEINHVITEATQGYFNHRLSLKDKNGFFKTFSESFNRILAINESAINDLLVMFTALAQGDLTKQITNEYQGALAQLKTNANLTANKLTEVMTVIQFTADNVKQTVQAIAEGSINLSQRTEEHAASLEETAAGMEEMTSIVQQNADNARQASQLAAIAKNQAEAGGNVVNSAIQAMNMIRDSSKQITDIITVINEIAFQTNLLALNAAVEAARAGEQGRGFAVVATEVRNLAQRSSIAAKEIRELIQSSVQRVEEGAQWVNQSGKTLQEIVDSVVKVNDIVAEIAAASQEQSAGIQQMNRAIAQMDEMTQQNAALAQESSASSEVLNQQALKLHEQVAFFKLVSTSKVAQSAAEKALGDLPMLKSAGYSAQARAERKHELSNTLHNLAAKGRAHLSAAMQNESEPTQGTTLKNLRTKQSVKTSAKNTINSQEWEDF